MSRDFVLDEILRLPDGYQERMCRGAMPAGGKQEEPEMRAIYARVEGLATGLGSTDARLEHVLLSLLWERSSILATRLIEKQGVTGKQVVAELRRRGIDAPDVPPPTRPKQVPPFDVSREEFERLTADLRRRGVLYRFNYKEGDQVVISIDERGEGLQPILLAYPVPKKNRYSHEDIRYRGVDKRNFACSPGFLERLFEKARGAGR